jgi:hypothetical protein
MAKSTTRKLIQDIFEMRYDRGYRYLDRCGDAMVVLEEALPQITNAAVWLPEEMAPKGARMKCPEYELTLVFDAGRLCLDQAPVDKQCPFANIAEYAYKTVVAKFGLTDITRLGHRQVYTLATDSIEEAEELSRKKALIDGQLELAGSGLSLANCDVKLGFESPDQMTGLQFSTSAAHTYEAPQRVDERLIKAPHLLREGQREALLEQIRQRKKRAAAPQAGLLIDIDYWELRPVSVDIQQFMQGSNEQIGRALASLLRG